ncbi:MAG: hypothetical protein HY917_04955 [Candidatus Diapherotrites archaeon]|nr:hypothetical protein [Candidatus Diapherotrites archaeon]
MRNVLRLGALSGILAFLASVPFLVLFALKFMNTLDGLLVPLYGVVTVFLLVFELFFTWGFSVIGNRARSRLMTYSTYLTMLGFLLLLGFEIISAFLPFSSIFVYLAILVILLAFHGLTQIAFGIGIFRLKTPLGLPGTVTAALSVISGISFLTIILTPLAILLLLPLTIAQAYCLFKASGQY